GKKTRLLQAREFHQIAGRAGRAGFDTIGRVVVEAPEHVIENEKALAKAGDDPKARRKVVKKKPPEGSIGYGLPTFERLRDSDPEPLTSSFTVSHAMILNVIDRPGNAYQALRHLLRDNHEPRDRQRKHVHRAIQIYRALLAGGVVERLDEPDEDGRLVRVTIDLQYDFALNQPLSPFALAAIELLSKDAPGSAPDGTDGTQGGQDGQGGQGGQGGEYGAAAGAAGQVSSYALDVLSIIEATLDDPRQILSAQQFRARGEALAAMKAEGIDYETRLELLDGVTWPKPLVDMLDAAYDIYRRGHPWVADYELSPKSVVRDMYERAMTFPEYVHFYSLSRSEGIVLRYLADAYRALRQTVPDDAKTDELADIIEWLGELVRQVDSSLIDEWEKLTHPDDDPAAVLAAVRAQPKGVTSNPRAFRVLVRNAMFRRVTLAALRHHDELGELDGADGWRARDWAAALDGYFDEYDEIGTGPDARGPGMLVLTEGSREWTVRQIFDDPAGDHDWGISATVDLAASDEEGTAVIHVTAVAPA
ncbi:MAG: box helicase, partial [Actinomycetia bacterium]|nr:box helicase [Actinomycetes bacterium]